jgi:hypothetical protein
MWSDRETSTVEVGDKAFFVGHGREWRRGVGLGKFFQQRAGTAYGFFDLPEGVATVKRQFRVSGFGFRVGVVTTETRRHGR